MAVTKLDSGGFIDKFIKAASTDDGKFFIAAALGAHVARKRKKVKQQAQFQAQRQAAIQDRQRNADKAALDYADHLDAFADKMDRQSRE